MQAECPTDYLQHYAEEFINIGNKYSKIDNTYTNRQNKNKKKRVDDYFYDLCSKSGKTIREELPIFIRKVQEYVEDSSQKNEFSEGNRANESEIEWFFSRTKFISMESERLYCLLDLDTNLLLKYSTESLNFWLADKETRDRYISTNSIVLAETFYDPTIQYTEGSVRYKQDETVKTGYVDCPPEMLKFLEKETYFQTIPRYTMNRYTPPRWRRLLEKEGFEKFTNCNEVHAKHYNMIRSVLGFLTGYQCYEEDSLKRTANFERTKNEIASKIRIDNPKKKPNVLALEKIIAYQAQPWKFKPAEKIVFLVGPQGTGKGTLSYILKGIHGICPSESTYGVDNFQRRTGMQFYNDKWINDYCYATCYFGDEVNVPTKKEYDFIKQLTEGGSLSGSIHYKGSRTFRNFLNVWIASNRMEAFGGLVPGNRRDIIIGLRELEPGSNSAKQFSKFAALMGEEYKVFLKDDANILDIVIEGFMRKLLSLWSDIELDEFVRSSYNDEAYASKVHTTSGPIWLKKFFNHFHTLIKASESQSSPVLKSIFRNSDYKPTSWDFKPRYVIPSQKVEEYFKSADGVIKKRNGMEYVISPETLKKKFEKWHGIFHGDIPMSYGSIYLKGLEVLNIDETVEEDD